MPRNMFWSIWKGSLTEHIKIGEGRDSLIFFKILTKFSFKIPHGVMDIRPIGEGGLICCLRTEISILHSAAKLACFWTLKISESHYLIACVFLMQLFICKRRILSHAILVVVGACWETVQQLSEVDWYCSLNSEVSVLWLWGWKIWLE